MCNGCVANVFGHIGGLKPSLSRRRFLEAAASAAAIAPRSLSASAARNDGCVERRSRIKRRLFDGRKQELKASDTDIASTRRVTDPPMTCPAGKGLQTRFFMGDSF